MSRKPNIELSVVHDGSKRVMKAELAAVGAFLTAMASDPSSCDVSIGCLHVTMHVNRCSKCFGSGRIQRSHFDQTVCSRCGGSGQELSEEDMRPQSCGGCGRMGIVALDDDAIPVLPPGMEVFLLYKRNDKWFCMECSVKE